MQAVAVRDRAPASGQRGTVACRSPVRPPVIVEWDGAPRKLELRVTEDDTDYGVFAECVDVLAEGFDVEVEERRVIIVLRASPHGRSPAREAAHRSIVHAVPVPSRVALVFDQPIDAMTSVGACADGLLHLSLHKRA